MPDLVRVRDGKWELNRGRAYAEAHGLTILDEPTHRLDGTPRPTTRANGRPIKPRTTVDAAARQKATQKRSSNKSAPKTSTSDSADTTSTTSKTSTTSSTGVADVASTARDEESAADDSTAREPTQKES